MKRLIYSVTFLLSILCADPRPAVAQATQPFIGEIEIFSFSFCPTGWVPLNGQLLAISDYVVLFELLGTTYGGDGQITFALPKWGPIVADGGLPLITCIAFLGVFPSRP